MSLISNKLPIDKMSAGKTVYALIYCRVSSMQQKTDGHGLDSQEHRCQQYAAQKGYVVENVFGDSVSGGGDFMKRPAMSKMLSYMDGKPYNKYVIIFDDLKRFARDVRFHWKLRDALQKRGARPECPNFNFEDTPEGAFVETLMAAQGELERQQNRRQVIQKQKARLERGYWPFGSKKGYACHKDPMHGKILRPNEEGKILAEALLSFAKRTLPRKVDVCRFLVERGFWHKQSPEKYIDKITEMMKDPFYAGYLEYSRWEVARRVGRHDGIISLETFELNQKLLQKADSIKRIRMNISPDFTLRGLVACDDCGSAYTGAWTRGRSGQRYPYYVCYTKQCQSYGKSVPRDVLERDFDELLGTNNLRPEAEKLIGVVFDRVWQKEIAALKDMEGAVAKERLNIQDKIKQFTYAAVNVKSEELRVVYEQEMEALVKELEVLSGRRLETLDMTIPYRTALNTVVGLLKSPYSVWVNFDVHEKRRLFYFIFSDKLSYSRKDGYRTEKTPQAITLFEEFVGVNTHDLEMGGIEPP